MHQNLLNSECASGLYRNAGDINMHVFGVMKALTKVLLKRFCCTYACCQLRSCKNYVIPAKAGIQCYQCLLDPPVKPEDDKL
jgi:hypothetical protein